MFLIYLAIYIIILLVVWWFYAVARMHTMKFKRFSTHIVPVTNFLLIFLLILSIIGFVLLFFIVPDETNTSWNSSSVSTQNEENTWETFKEEIIWNQHY